MHTTVTIDPDVEVLLKIAVHQQGKRLDEVVNDTLRHALASSEKPKRDPYVLKTRPLGIKVDLTRARQFSEELEGREIIGKLRELR